MIIILMYVILSNDINTVTVTELLLNGWTDFNDTFMCVLTPEYFKFTILNPVGGYRKF